MKIKIIITALSFLTILSGHALAENIVLQNIRVGGTGCPMDITQIVTAPDLSSASIIFQSFESHVPAVLTNPKASPYISILNCNVFVDIKLPANMKLDSLEISYDMRGAAILDTGVSGSFKSFLISSNGMGTERSQRTQMLQEKNWLNSGADQQEDFLVQSTKSLPINSNCGIGSRSDLVTVHLQHQLASQILRGHERTSAEGTITMDSSDMKGGLKLNAHGSACRGQDNQGGGNGRNCRITRVNGRAVRICQ
ncbi:MAG: DUF4360 domain-containing protein [Bacteriovorax sp.]